MFSTISKGLLLSLLLVGSVSAQGITGTSTGHVLGYCNGTNWTVAAK